MNILQRGVGFLCGLRFRLMCLLLLVWAPVLGLVSYSGWENRRRELGGWELIGALAVVAGWVGGDLLFLRRIKALVSSTTKLAAGDLGVRAGQSGAASELDGLAGALDQMAATLEQREAERKRGEELLRESEEKYRRIVDTANEGIWVLDPDLRITFTNRRIGEMLGCQEQEMTGRGLDCFVFQEDLPHFVDRMEMRRNGMSERYECRLRRKDGQVLWALVSSTPIRDGGGCFEGSFAMVSNITERRQAEAALRGLSGEILRLQDEERRHVARELHDHAAQWLAALAMNLTTLDSMVVDSNAEAKRLLSEGLRILDQCSLEIRTVSYLLHPPLLDELGLVGAIEEYVEEFARRSGIHVRMEFPPELVRFPKEVELTLFRILQESLINVHRHSGGSSATVGLTKDATEIKLEVIDTGHGMKAGVGQECSGAKPRRIGVGIAGMRERLRQLGGRLEIESSLRGTTIRARLPLWKENHELIAHSGGR